MEFEFGTGFGFAGEFDYYGYGVDISATTDMPHIVISDKGYEEYIQTELSLTMDFIIFEVGPHYTEYDVAKSPEFTWFKEKDTITLFSVGGALFYGFNISVNIDHNYIIDSVVSLFEKK